MKAVFFVIVVSVFSNQVQAQLGAGRLTVLTSKEDPSIQEQTAVFKWQGEVGGKMAQDLQEAFERLRSDKNKIVLDLSSEGGSTTVGAEVIRLLREIKATHKLDTIVLRGEKCASMCVPIFLQGQKRYGARTSSWMFHGARRWWTTVPDPFETDRSLVYFRDAGVNESWLQGILRYMREPGEYWQTGGDLIDARSGIITHELPNHRRLPVESLPIDPQIRPR